MLKLKTLKFKNIGRFVEPQEISFEKLGNLVQIDAQNNITGGSSGSGKSTIFNSLDWLLGLSDLSTTVLQSRLTKEGISVEGLFDWDGKEVLIQRSKKLSISVDGIETTGSSKLSEELLDQIIGMPRNLFRQLVHKRQGDQGFFLQQTPAQMNSFLTDCLNLASIRSKIDLIDQKTKELELSKTQVQNDMQASQAALEAIESAQVALGEEPILEVTQPILEVRKGVLSLASSRLELTKEEHLQERTALEKTKPQLTTIPFDRTTLNSIEKDCEEIVNGINTVNSREKERQAGVNERISALKLDTSNQISTLKLDHQKYISGIKTKIKELTDSCHSGIEAKNKALKIGEELKQLRSGICYTCQQSWITQKAKEQEQTLLQELDKYRLVIEKAASLVEIDSLESQSIDSINAHNEMLGAITKESKHKLDTLLVESSPVIPDGLEDLQDMLKILNNRKEEEKQKEIAHNVEQNANNQKLLESFLNDQKLLSSNHQKVIDSLNKDVEEARSQYEQALSALKSHTEALARYKTSMDSLKTKENSIHLKLVDINHKLVDMAEKLEIAEEVKRCLKSYLSCSFDDALDSISETATRILRSVPTMANATVRLIGTKEMNSGAVKEQVNAVLDNDGELEVPIKSLSGGERSAVDLAIDLAVCEMIQEKANKGIDIMILDEPFGGFDSIGVEHALEMLKTLDKRILLVEHNPVAKEFINDKITVTRDEETSCIK